MSDVERPGWCQNEACLCLTSYGGRICVGRLPAKVRHDDLFNTHNFCLEEDTFAINDADAYYLEKCMQRVQDDVKQHGLYNPGRGSFYAMGEKS